MESSFASRVKQFRAEKQLSQTAFAERCGLTQGNVAHMEGGKEPLQSNVGKLISGFPDLNPDWLLLGTGEMLRSGRTLTPAAQLPPPVPSEAKPTLPGSGERTMPHMAINAEGEMYWRSIATERLKQIESLEKTVERLWKQNDTLLEGKPEASPEAASLRETVDALAHELPSATGGRLGFQIGVHRQLAAAS